MRLGVRQAPAHGGDRFQRRRRSAQLAMVSDDPLARGAGGGANGSTLFNQPIDAGVFRLADADLTFILLPGTADQYPLIE
jgi:hypothetical protein